MFEITSETLRQFSLAEILLLIAMNLETNRVAAEAAALLRSAHLRAANQQSGGRRYDLRTHTSRIHAITGFRATPAGGFPELSGTAAVQSGSRTGSGGSCIRRGSLCAVVRKGPWFSCILNPKRRSEL